MEGCAFAVPRALGVDALNTQAAVPAPAPQGFRHASTQVEGATIHYLIGGRGPPVMLLHGWPVTAYAWRGVAPALADRFTVIAPDMPGFGDSGFSSKGYEKQVIAEEVRDLVRQLGFKDILLVGHDMGGVVAFAYAAEHPQEVRKLALVETLMPGFGLEDLKATGAWHIGLAQVPELPETLVCGREREFLSYFYKRGILRPGAVGEAELSEYFRTYTAPDHMSASFDYYRALKADAPQFRAMVAAQKLPMAVLAVGAERGLGSGADSFRPLVEQLREVIIPASGHHIPDDQPQALAQVLGTFFAEP